jgi:multidrug efflux pump subunit AcrB
VLALLGIYFLLAIPFGSYTQPLIVMVSIPFGVVGAVIGHALMGYNLSVMSLMGMIALSGVVVNDSLVLISYANQLRDQGMSLADAVCNAGVRRFRPILLTTLTTFGGLAPMIFETSRQARFMIPMALSLGYGILFATFISLLIVPCLYLVVEDVKRVLGVGRSDHETTSTPARATAAVGN